MKQLLMLFCAITLLSFVSCKKERDRSVPIEGTYTTTNEILAPAPLLKQRITGIGQSTHLNIIKFVAVSVMNTTTPPPFQISGPATFYAGNGDVFYTTFKGTSTPNPDGTLTVVMTHTITGGTGKFKHASGTFIGTTIANLKNPTNTIVLKGVLIF